MNEKEFISYLEKLGINIDENKLFQLEKYYELLVTKNQVMNLTNITEKESVYLKHFYDSITLTIIHNFMDCESICDIGTGAGFPGVVLKIIFPHLKVVLIDSLEKRIKFLNELINELQLNDIEAIHIRAEDYARKNREMFDIVTSRAVAKLSILNELCLPLVKVNGFFISMKGSAEEELNEINNNLKLLGGQILEVKSFLLPYENSKRTLIKIKKAKKSDTKYPRDFKEIKKKPL